MCLVTKAIQYKLSLSCHIDFQNIVQHKLQGQGQGHEPMADKMVQSGDDIIPFFLMLPDVVFQKHPTPPPPQTKIKQKENRCLL